MILIDAQTAAVSTAVPFIVRPDQLPCSVRSAGLAGAETVTVKMDVNGTMADFPDNGITATKQAITLLAPGKYGVIKSATAAATTVTAPGARKP